MLGLLEEGRLEEYLRSKYAFEHPYKSDKALFGYANELKNSYMKNAAPLAKAIYDNKIHVINNALGTHHYISRVQGGRLKSKNEIRIAALFRELPEEFLRMIVVHELAHFNHKEHDKAFYKLCEYMERSYHQYEFDLRLYLTLKYL